MTLEKFQELAPKTVNDLTVQIPLEEVDTLSYNTLGLISQAGRRANLGHMAMGMSGEVLSELLVAYHNNDEANVLEEATDAKWYIVVAAWMKDYELSSEILANHKSTNPYYGLIDGFYDSEFAQINLTVGTLVDVLKRESCYGKAKYQGELISEEQYLSLFYDAIKAIDDMLISNELSPEEGYDKVIEKLHGQRYKNADGSVGYTDEKALHRDLEAEKKIIDN